MFSTLRRTLRAEFHDVVDMKTHVAIFDQMAVARVDFERHGPGIRRHGGYGTLEQLPLGDIEVLTACRIRAVLGPQDDDAGRCPAQEPALDLALAFRTQGDPVVEDRIGNKQRPLDMQVVPAPYQTVEIVVVEHRGILLEAFELAAAVKQEKTVRVLFRFVVKNEFR